MNRTKLLIWIIIVLVAINLAALISGVAYSMKRRNEPPARTGIPFNQRADFFYEQLGLTSDQRNQFFVFNKEFNQDARLIADKMNSLRYTLIKEMARSNPDRSKLDEICTNIGSLHSELKEITVDYYLKMKSICDPQQQKLLNELFEMMLEPDGIIYGRGRGGQGRGRGFNQTDPGRGRESIPDEVEYYQ